MTKVTNSAHMSIPTQIAPQLHLGRWTSAIIVAVLLTTIVVSLWNNPAIEHDTVLKFLTAKSVLEGLRMTVILAVLSMAIGTLLATIMAVFRLSKNPVLQSVGAIYVWFFRGVPLLVQILIWGNFALFYPTISIGIPFTPIGVTWETNAVITGFVASVIALSLNESGYMAEIIRAGLMSISPGQAEATKALGFSRWHAFRYVTLPQALRIILPPTATQFINMLKMTSLVSVIAGGDLLTNVLNISAANLKTIELLVVATFWYLVLTSVASIGQSLLERRLGRGTKR